MEKKLRVTYSPGEFAALFNRSQTWGYRQLYAGKISAITEHGRIMIPATEIERILATAGIYNGIKPKKPQTKTDYQKLIPWGTWQRFLERRRATNTAKPSPHSGIGSAARGRLPWAGKSRQAAIRRLGGLRASIKPQAAGS